MIRLILVRHGNTFDTKEIPRIIGARCNPSLTIQGCEQAKQFARYLISQKITPNTIYAGELKRQIETAQIIKAHLPIECPIESHQVALTEIDYGVWEGLTQEEVLSQWSQEYNDWTIESRWAKEVFGRTEEEHIRYIKNWVEHLRTDHASGDVVIAVTSNGLIRFFYSLQEKAWQLYVKERQMEKLKVKTGHFCEIQVFKDLIKIKHWNVKP